MTELVTEDYAVIEGDVILPVSLLGIHPCSLPLF